GLPSKLMHDNRRTVAHNMDRAGGRVRSPNRSRAIRLTVCTTVITLSMNGMCGRVWLRPKPTSRRSNPDTSWTIQPSQKISPHKLLIHNEEAYRCWCAAWTSNPVIAANPRDGGFDSHTLPPH